MTPRPWSGLLAAIAVACLGSLASGQADFSRSLRDLTAKMEALSKDDAAKLTDADLDRLERAAVVLDRFAGRDLCGLAIVLEFGDTVADGDLPALAAAAQREEWMAVRWSVAFLLIDRKNLVPAARLMVVAGRDMPRDRRAYSTWKRIDSWFSAREGYLRLKSDLALALLGLVADATDADRQVIGDLFGETVLSKEQVPELRERIEKAREAEEEMTREMWALIDEQDAGKPEKLWIEDRRGLRQVDRRAFTHSQRSPDRYEIRLCTRAVAAASEREWGVLRLKGDDHGEGVTELRGWLLDLVRRAGDVAADWDSQVGVIAVLVSAPRTRTEIDARIERLSEALPRATTACILACLAADCEPALRYESRAVALAREGLAAVRLCAGRMAELGHGRKVASTDTDDAALDALAGLADHSAALLRDTGLFDRRPATGDHWTAMPFVRARSDDDGSRIEDPGFLRVVLAGDEMQFTMLTRSGVEIVRVSRRALRDATYDTGEPMTIETSEKIEHRVVDLGSQFRSGSLRSWRSTSFTVPCGNNERRREIAAALRAFADGR